VKSFTRGLGLALLILGMLGVTGCGPDNDTEALKAQKVEKDPGPINPKAVATNPPVQAQTQQQQYEQSQKLNTQGKASGYPGAKK